MTQSDDRALLDAAEAAWQRLAADKETLIAYRRETGGLDAFSPDLRDTCDLHRSADGQPTSDP